MVKQSTGKGKSNRTSGTHRAQRVSRSLVALSSAAILGVYAIGYTNTQGAAESIANQQAQAAVANSTTAAPAPGSSSAVLGVGASPPLSLAVPSPVAVLFEKAGARPTPSVTPRAESASAAASGPSPVASTGGPATATTPENAPLPSPTSAPTATPNQSAYRDGTYTGQGYSRHGDIEATVVITGGRIVSANVSRCSTRYPCQDVIPLVQETLQTQAVPVDYVSGASDSSQAYQGAVEQALAQAKR